MAVLGPQWDRIRGEGGGESCFLWNDVSFKAAAPLSGSTRLDLLDEVDLFESWDREDDVLNSS